MAQLHGAGRQVGVRLGFLLCGRAGRLLDGLVVLDSLAQVCLALVMLAHDAQDL